MRSRAQIQMNTAATGSPSFMPVRTGLPQSKRACGGSPDMTGGCEGRRGASLMAPRLAANDVESSAASFITRSPDHADNGALTASPFGHSFSRVRMAVDGYPPTFLPSLPQDSRLPAQTPAWAENGAIHMGPAGLLMAPMERQRVLRMKMVHALHQRLAPPGESTESRRHAEGLAARGADRAGGFALADFLTPSPALLAFPPQSYSPWSKVWIGHAGLIGEVVDAGVTVRIFMTYEELGIEHKPGFQGYECGEHDIRLFPTWSIR